MLLVPVRQACRKAMIPVICKPMASLAHEIWPGHGGMHGIVVGVRRATFSSLALSISSGFLPTVTVHERRGSRTRGCVLVLACQARAGGPHPSGSGSWREALGKQIRYRFAHDEPSTTPRPADKARKACRVYLDRSVIEILSISVLACEGFDRAVGSNRCRCSEPGL